MVWQERESAAFGKLYWEDLDGIGSRDEETQEERERERYIYI